MEKAVEFLNCKCNDKYNKSSFIYFEDGERMGAWFGKNKDVILSSKTGNLFKIKEDYEEFLKNRKNKMMLERKSSIKFTNFKLKMYEEFAACEDLNKFDYENTSLKFTNGFIMSRWFFENKRSIFSNRGISCEKIKEQYIKKQELDKRRKKILDKKYKQELYIEKNYNKFDLGCRLYNSNGENFGSWFDRHFKEISSSTSEIDKRLIKQWNIAKELIDLKTEIAKREGLDKFDSNGNVRFETGALIYFFWANNMNDILKRTSKIDEILSIQYEEYLNSKNNFIDGDLPVKKELVKIKD